MPAFHTKTIHYILDPVAQQVSQLVILHEDAQQGRIMPDISAPVTAVCAAVQNLIAVGQQTVGHSKDEILKKDLPLTLDMVESSSKMLVESATGLKADSQSKKHLELLLNGARGYLLLTFDQGEVRKIVKSCTGVAEYIKVAEVVQTMDDLVTFTKNLSPGITSMTKMVETRYQDLTNPSHASILAAENDQVKQALPLLLSSMKAFVTFRRDKKKGEAEAQENRNYIVQAMGESLAEIIRVLQLTSQEEVMMALAAETGSAKGTMAGGLLMGSLAAKVHSAKELVSQTGTNAQTNKAGIQAVEAVLEEARRIAKTLPADRKAVIEGLCDELESLKKELAMLQSSGQGDSARAHAIATALNSKMDELQMKLREAITRKVAEDFMDPVGPLNALTEASRAPLNAPARAENYVKRVTDFQDHSKKMADTAVALAKSGIVTDKNLADSLLLTAGKLKAVAPQVVYAAKIVYENPDSKEAKEHYDMLKEDYQKQVQKLTKLVDSGLDTVEFLKASESMLRDELEAARTITKAGTDPQSAFKHIATAARTANRVVAVVQGESENSEDPAFKTELASSSQAITAAIGPMVTSAKTCIQQGGSATAHHEFCVKAENLAKAVHDVYNVVDTHHNPPPPPPPPPVEEAPERPPLPAEPEVPPRPPSPELVEVVPLQSVDPIGYAAHKLDKDAKQWEDNEMVTTARRMAKLFMQMSKFARGEEGEVHSKKDFINTARMIAKESEDVVKMARKVADACTDKRMKRAILQLVDKLPTISTQLKIIAAVKATRQGGDDAAADREATEMLTDNAQNLMQAVSEVLFATEAATIRVPPDQRATLGLQWVKKGARTL
ncbi:hypothetical protein EMCRGX_G023541 [Ephydatia muelleri]